MTATAVQHIQTHSTVYSLCVLLMRVMLGGMIASHGLNKFFGGGKIAGTAGWFDSMGMRPGRLNALLAATTEVGVGLLLIVGLLTPLACAGLVSIMVVAIITVHLKNGFFVFNAGQGIEYCLVVAVMAIALGGLDHASGHRAGGGRPGGCRWSALAACGLLPADEGTGLSLARSGARLSRGRHGRSAARRSQGCQASHG